MSDENKRELVVLVSRGLVGGAVQVAGQPQSDAMRLQLMRLYYLVNTSNWRIEKVVGSLAMKGGEMRFLTEYSDFTFRDGVLVHERENKFAAGVNTAVLRLRQITLDTNLEDTDFLPADAIISKPKQDQEDII